MVNEAMNWINSRKTSGIRFLLTSSTIVRGIRNLYREGEVANKFMRTLQDGFLEVVKAYMYTFVSRTRSKFFLPQLFSRFTQSGNHFFFAHIFKRRFLLRHKLIDFLQVFLGLLGTVSWCFHLISPLSKVYYSSRYLSITRKRLIIL